MRSIEGLVAWVTGAGSGIGRAGALSLAGAGAKVVLSGRRREALDATAQAIAASGGEAVVETLDVADAASVAAVAARSDARFGRLGLVALHAGINVAEPPRAAIAPAGRDPGGGGGV